MGMKLVKGLVVAGLITTGVMMMWNDDSMTAKKMTKMGKRCAKKIGIM